MAKDYKTYSNTKKKSGSAPKKGKLRVVALWIVLILLIAAFARMLVFVSHKSKETKMAQKIEQKQEVKKPEPPKIKFEFYTILPKEQVNVPENNAAPVVSAPAPASVSAPIQAIPTLQNGYVLQVASARNFTDADNLRAKLALDGINNVTIQKNTVQGVVWYRVQVGPFSTREEALSSQQKLRQDNVDSLIKKIG